MSAKHFIPTATLCSHYNIEIAFVEALDKMGLIQIKMLEEAHYIHQDQLGDLEKIIRLHKELNINLEGIDVVFNLLKKEQELRNELTLLRNKLRLYENS